jgi:hypothetical protein
VPGSARRPLPWRVSRLAHGRMAADNDGASGGTRAASLTLVDATALDEATCLKADICVNRRRGPPASTLALELDRKGAMPCCWSKAAASPRTRAVQSLLRPRIGGLPAAPRLHVRAPAIWAAAAIFWAGRCILLSKMDIEGRPWVRDTAWPIGQEEIARHYEAAGDHSSACRGSRPSSSLPMDRLLTQDEHALVAHRRSPPRPRSGPPHRNASGAA